MEVGHGPNWGCSSKEEGEKKKLKKFKDATYKKKTPQQMKSLNLKCSLYFAPEKHLKITSELVHIDTNFISQLGETGP
jgi:hypothetical protein